MAKSTRSGPGKQRSKPPVKSVRKSNEVKNYPANETSSFAANEDAVTYASQKKQRAEENAGHFDKYRKLVSALLSDATNKPESHMTPLEKMGIAREGISKKDLESLKEKTALDYDKLAVALSVTRATLINKKGEEKFNSTLSERIIDLAGLYSYGYEVFEDEARFNQWMFRPNRALGGQAPYDIIDNQFGREEVRNIIGRIEYGVYS